jgi:DNA-binding PadR family transcriptional regulator
MMRRTMEPTRTELAVLGLLAWSGESSGYELHRRAARSVGFIWAPARSQLYAVLKRLAAAGLATSRDVAQRDRPDKRLFELTEAGEETLRAWLNRVDPIEPEDRDGVLLKVFFAAYAPPGAIEAQLLDFRERTQARLDTYREIEATFPPEPDLAEWSRLQTLRLGIGLMRASVEWADETIAALALTEPQ